MSKVLLKVLRLPKYKKLRGIYRVLGWLSSCFIRMISLTTATCKRTVLTPALHSSIRYGLELDAYELPIEDLAIIFEEAGSKMMSRPLSLIHVDSQSI